MHASIKRIIVAASSPDARRSLWLWHLASAACRALNMNAPMELNSGWLQRLQQRYQMPASRLAAINARNASLLSGELAMLQESFAGSLVIGWQLPEIILRGLNSLGIPWLDFAEHPARFMRDSAFGVRSSLAEMRHAFGPARIPKPNIIMAGGQFMASRALQGGEINEPVKNSGLFVCISDEKMGELGLEMRDFETQFRKIMGKHQLLLVIAASEADRSHLYLTQLFPAVRLAKKDFYDLVRNPEIRAIYSFSPAIAAEARYLGKAGICLFEHGPGFESETLEDRDYLPIKNCLGDLETWREIFKGAGLSCEASANSIVK